MHDPSHPPRRFKRARLVGDFLGGIAIFALSGVFLWIAWHDAEGDLAPLVFGIGTAGIGVAYTLSSGMREFIGRANVFFQDHGDSEGE